MARPHLRRHRKGADPGPSAVNAGVGRVHGLDPARSRHGADGDDEERRFDCTKT